MMGDFNAKMASLGDFAKIDEDLLDRIDIAADEMFITDIANEQSKYGHNIKRVSQDKKTNKTGNMLLDN